MMKKVKSKKFHLCSNLVVALSQFKASSLWSVLHIPIFSIKSYVFLKKNIEALRYTMFVWQIFLANLFAWQNNQQIVLDQMSTFRNSNNSSLSRVSALYSRSCITHTLNIKTDWQFRNKLILSTFKVWLVN